MSHRPKILYLMAGDPSIFGGGKRVFMQLMTYLNKEEFQFYSCCAFDKKQEDFLSKHGGTIVHIDIQYGGFWQSIKKLIDLLREEKIDIVHSQGGRADFYARMAARMLKPKVKVVNTTAVTVESYDVGALRKGAYLFFDRFSESYVDRFIVVSEALRRILINTHKISDDKVIKIYNGIELNEYQPDDSGEFSTRIRKEYNIGKDVFLVGTVGRMVWPKRFEYLIRSIPEIVKNYPKVKVLLVGDGVLKKNLEDLTERLELKDRIIFTGFRSDIKDILSTVDLLVIPSLQEGFPMITLEAMAMAKPIIATNIDGITEQITDGVNGILVPPKDPSALAKAIIKVINDKELAMTMGLAARKKVEQEFSVEKMVSETEKVYQSLA